MSCYAACVDLQDGWDSIELIPNIILNPGFSESDGTKNVQPFTRHILFGHTGQQYTHNVVDDDDDDDDDDYEEEEDLEPTMEKFKRKVSVFFTGPTIKRIWKYKVQFYGYAYTDLFRLLNCGYGLTKYTHIRLYDTL